jgi:hypothetical protein
MKLSMFILLLFLSCKSKDITIKFTGNSDKFVQSIILTSKREFNDNNEFRHYSVDEKVLNEIEYFILKLNKIENLEESCLEIKLGTIKYYLNKEKSEKLFMFLKKKILDKNFNAHLYLITKKSKHCR